MSLGYWITIAIWGVVTLAVLCPPFRPLPLARAAFLVSTAVNEVPLVFLVLFLVPTVRAIATDGDLHSLLGVLELVPAAAVVAGMLTVVVRTVRARGVVARAVGLPAGSRQRWWAALLPLPLRPRAVERTADVSYLPAAAGVEPGGVEPGGVEPGGVEPGGVEPGGAESGGAESGGAEPGGAPGSGSLASHDGHAHLLDVYRHRSTPDGAPVLVYFHGGGFSGGNKHLESRHLWNRMASRGWIVVSANYGLRPHTTFPGHLVDAKRVLAWVRTQGRELGADPSTLVVAGSSAGGHLAAMCALTANRAEFQPGFETADTGVSAAVGLYGYYGRYYGGARGEEPSSLPADYSASGAPPMLLVHGTHDTFVSVRGARKLVEHLRGGSPNPVGYVELPYANHGFDVFASLRFRAVVDGIEEFLRRTTLPTR